MEEEEQFENIDLNDDNICSICKLETETGTLSFCHVCFELNLEGKTRVLVQCRPKKHVQVVPGELLYDSNKVLS